MWKGCVNLIKNQILIALIETKYNFVDSKLSKLFFKNKIFAEK